MRPWVIAAAAMLATSACTTDDPTQGGFFGGLAGIASGSYERRIDEQSAAWIEEEARYQEEVATKVTLDTALSERRSQAVYLERQTRLFEKDAAALHAEVAALRTDKDATVDQIVETEADVARLLDQIDKVQSEQEPPASGSSAVGTGGDPDAEGASTGDKIGELRGYIVELQDTLEALKAARAGKVGSAPESRPSGLD